MQASSKTRSIAAGPTSLRSSKINQKYKNLEEKNWKRYYLLAIVSFLFHISSLIIFFFPLLKNINIKNIKPKTIILLVVIGLPLAFLKGSFLSFFSNFLFTDSMVDRAETYSQSGFSTAGLLSFYFVRVILPLPFLLALKNSNFVKNNGMLLGFIILSIFAQIIVSFERFLNYIYIWLIVQFINEIYRKNINLIPIIKRNIFKTSFAGMLFFIILYKIPISDGYGNYYYSIFFPYESKFDKVQNEHREKYIHSLWGY